ALGVDETLAEQVAAARCGPGHGSTDRAAASCAKRVANGRQAASSSARAASTSGCSCTPHTVGANLATCTSPVVARASTTADGGSAVTTSSFHCTPRL